MRDVAYQALVFQRATLKNREWPGDEATHFLCKQHIPHTTNFDKLINLVVSCGGKDLDEFVHLE